MSIIRKKIWLIIILLMAFCVWLPNCSKAATLNLDTVKSKGADAVGMTGTLKKNTVFARNDTYCLSPSTVWDASASPTYKVKSYISIIGNKATGKPVRSGGYQTITSKYNLVMAYIIAAGNGKYDSNGNNSAAQEAIWTLGTAWINRVASNFSYTETDSQKGLGGTVWDNANKKADAIAPMLASFNLTNKTNASNIKVTTYQNNSNYNVVGPFKWTFDHGSVVQLKYETTKGNSTIVHEVVNNGDVSYFLINGSKSDNLSNIKSGSSFYAMIPKDENLKKVTIKVSEGTVTLPTAKIWILTSSGSQNFILTSKGTTKKELSSTSSMEVNLTTSTPPEPEPEPEPETVDIEGTVFLDGKDGKESAINNTYDAGEGFDGIRVVLKRNGKVIANVASGYDSNGKSTGTAGHYKFYGDVDHLKIEKGHLSEYSIEFEYNGLKYENVAIQPQIVAGPYSKAKEKDQERETFNTKYSTVTADQKIEDGMSSNRSKGGNIIWYTSKNHTSQVYYSTSKEDDKGNPYDIDGYADDQYHITAYTTEAGLDFSKPNKSGGYPYDPTKDSIVDVNFGIREREHPDVAITTDLATAETSINGYTQIYPYQKRYDQIGNDTAFTVQVKSSDAYYPSYQRNLYESDVEYTRQTSDGSELAVYLTYKVVIKNQSSSINVTVNDIVDYFSKDVTGGIVAIGTSVNTLSEITAKTNGNRYQVTNTNGMQYSSIGEDSGYSKQYITLNKEIKTNEKYEFYVQYKMTSDAIKKTIDGSITFNNVLELNTVSAKSNNGEIWTAVDMDSAVGNCVPGDKQTMEDDTDYAPGINIEINTDRGDADDGIRKISGIVFEDKAESDEFQTGKERKGDGVYNAGEEGIPNATVQLIDIDRGKIAYSNTNGTDIISDSNGNYTLNGFIPGNYIIKYTYGNGTGKYTAQQYKSTIYVDQNRANTNYSNGYHDGVSTGNKYWYLDDGDTRSDAVDNYNGEIQTLYDISQATVNKSRTEIEKIWNQVDGYQHILNGTSIDNTIAIDAYTPHMGVTVEMNNAQEEKYEIQHVDFGIVERARYKVQIDKVINRIQIKQADGSILRDFTDFNNPPANTKAIPSQRGKNRGFVQFEIDSELLQSSTLLVEYGFQATNISEVEYVDEDYYKYGIVPQDKDNKVVKLSIANIIDYVDNELMYAENNHMISEGNTKTNGENGWSTIDLSKDENKKYVSKDDVLNKIYDVNGKCVYNTMLISNGLESTMLSPGNKTNTIGLSLNKLLVPIQDEMRYENLVEVVEVKKTWGRELSMEETTNGAGDGQKLGNLDPTEPENDEKVINVKDPDTHYSETIIINPPTGIDKNSIVQYTIIGIVSLTIMAVGIIIIKKKVLN